MAVETYLLNLTFLENRLGELGLKNWWVAEHIGVDRKTLSRWLTGKVKTIKNENLLALAECLKCSSEELVLKDDSSVIASKEEQAIAAELIVQENLLSTLTPSGQWPLLQSIVKSTMQPNLPLPVMGKLYNLLSVCSWRQDEIEKAKGFATKALSIGNQIGHRGVIAQAKSNLALVYFYKGQLKESILLFETVISERKFIDDERTMAAAFSNLAQNYQIYGDFVLSRKMQIEAIELYSALALPLNLSIAYCGLGLLMTELEDYSSAELALQKSLEFATTANYVRGLHALKIYLADVFGRMGDFVKAESFLNEGLMGFQNLKLKEALNFEISARIARLQGDWDKAEVLLEQGLGCAQEFPLEIASLEIEYSKLWEVRKNPVKALEAKNRAIAIYLQAGAELRVQRLA